MWAKNALGCRVTASAKALGGEELAHLRAGRQHCYWKAVSEGEKGVTGGNGWGDRLCRACENCLKVS